MSGPIIKRKVSFAQTLGQECPRCGSKPTELCRGRLASETSHVDRYYAVQMAEMIVNAAFAELDAGNC